MSLFLAAKLIAWGSHQHHPNTMTHFFSDHKPLIVLLSGWAGSGKDAAATLMVEEMGFMQHAFANSLKADVARTTGIPLENFHSHYAKNRSLATPCSKYPTAQTPRDVLIQHAAAARATDPDVFAKHVADSIRMDMTPRHVISDWRYPNEYEWLRGAFTCPILRVRVQRDSVVPLNDPTEHYLDEAPLDAILHNNGHIADLRDSIKTILHQQGTRIQVGR
jgi:hypothetical protein